MDREQMQELINGMRKIVKPYLAKQLKKLNFEGCGNTDKAEFETDFEIVLTLAEQALAIPSSQKWIPVSERLPEEREWIGTKQFGTTISDEVYVTFEMPNGERFTDHLSFQNGELSPMMRSEINAFHKGAKPIAWCELPEPWKGKQDG